MIQDSFLYGYSSSLYLLWIVNFSFSEKKKKKNCYFLLKLQTYQINTII